MKTVKLLVTGGSGFIGSHLIDEIVKRSYDLVNLDVKPPAVSAQERFWKMCDIKNKVELAALFNEFQPTHVIHLAAKANLNGRTINDFPDNTIGTANIVDCVNATDSVRMFVNTSTQYVVRPGLKPIDDNYLEPYTAYGESKAAAERIVRKNCVRNWAIIRPTNIWGPGHAFFPYELWRYLERRYYVHPGFQPIYKHYGYIDNAVKQILSVAFAENPEQVAGGVWYITDATIDNYDWMNGFSLGLSGKPVRRAPIQLWRLAAMVGDQLRRLGFKFPVYSERLFRLTVSECIPNNMIVKLPEDTVVKLQEGIDSSIAWYRSVISHSRPRAIE
ncbi:NAD-dependent epimerase/dehydratase family protein [Metallibacterium sp.]